MSDTAFSERIQPVMETYQVAGRPIHIERFAPVGPTPHPMVFLLHGADGLPGRGLPYRSMAARLAGHGYRTYLPHYYDATDGGGRPNPLNPLNFAAWLEAITEGIAHVAQQQETGPGPVGLIGFSLGGYLAVAAGSMNPHVTAVVECCGGAADLFLRPETTPPVLILHGGADPVVPVSEAHRLEAMLKRYGRPYEMWIYPGRGHQLTGPDFEDALRRTRDFLARHLRPLAA